MTTLLTKTKVAPTILPQLQFFQRNHRLTRLNILCSLAKYMDFNTAIFYVKFLQVFPYTRKW